jgi:hypothetical protein
MAQGPDLDIQMDATSLWREEIVTDRRAGTLRLLVPVRSDGTADPARPTHFVGEVQIMTQAGPLPISFEIEAKTLAEAVERYGAGAKAAVERTVAELQELRRQAQSSLIVPSAGGALDPSGGLGGLPGLGGGGLVGGGKIRMP